MLVLEISSGLQVSLIQLLPRNFMGIRIREVRAALASYSSQPFTSLVRPSLVARLFLRASNYTFIPPSLAVRSAKQERNQRKDLSTTFHISMSPFTTRDLSTGDTINTIGLALSFVAAIISITLAFVTLRVNQQRRGKRHGLQINRLQLMQSSQDFKAGKVTVGKSSISPLGAAFDCSPSELAIISSPMSCQRGMVFCAFLSFPCRSKGLLFILSMQTHCGQKLPRLLQLWPVLESHG